MAALYGHLEVVKILLEDSRVDPSDQNNFAIHEAEENGHLDIVRLLLDNDYHPCAHVPNFSLQNRDITI